jgi:Ni/Co efflux regulator RcnB
MKKTMLALFLGALVTSGAAIAGPFQYDEHHDQDKHANVVEHDRGMHEGWYHKGGAVPPEYRDHRYVVDNWRDYHLHEPPRGYQWVRSDNGEFLLVAVTTGIITDIMLNH